MISWYILYGIIFVILIILMMMVPWMVGDINMEMESEIDVCETDEGELERGKNKVDELTVIEDEEMEEIKFGIKEEEKKVKEDEREIKEVIEGRREIVRRGRRRGFRVKNVFK